MSGRPPVRDLQAFEEHLRSAWCAESSGKWSAESPARGQCSVTALVVHDLFGGEILNRRPAVGFTLSQFGRSILFDDTPSSWQEALADTTPAQYEALKARLGMPAP